MSKIIEDYSGGIVRVNNNDLYFITFYDVKGNLKRVEVSKEVFLQIFGVHKIEIIDEQKHYFILYKDNQYEYRVEVSFEDYKKFWSFKSQIIRDNNNFNRYIEQSEQSESILYKKGIYKLNIVEDTVHKKIINDKLYIAIDELNEIHRRRFIMYYLEEMTYEEIALEDDCSKQAVKYSIDIAKSI